MAQSLTSYFRELVNGWIGLMSTLLGVMLNIIGWFFVPDVVAIRPYVIAVGVIALFIASFNAWLAKHKQLEQITANRPQITVGTHLEFDSSSSLFRLSVVNMGNGLATIAATVRRVLLDDGQAHPDSARLPIRLQWMHFPGRDAVELGAEKVDVAFVQIVPGAITYSSTRVWSRDKEGRPISRFPMDAEEPKVYLAIAGVTFQDFRILLKENESINCEIVIYGSENRSLSTTWCRFTRDTKIQEDVICQIVEQPTAPAREPEQ